MAVWEGLVPSKLCQPKSMLLNVYSLFFYLLLENTRQKWFMEGSVYFGSHFEGAQSIMVGKA